MKLLDRTEQSGIHNTDTMIKSIQTFCSNHQIVKLHSQLKSLSKGQIKKELMVCKNA